MKKQNKSTHPAISKNRQIKRLILPCSRSIQARIVHKAGEFAGALNMLFGKLNSTKNMPLKKQLQIANVLRHTTLQNILSSLHIAQTIEFACEKRISSTLPRVLDAILKAAKNL